MKLLIDGAVCMGHGRCYTFAPDLIAYDDEGFPTIRDELTEVPVGQAAAAEDVAATCPEGAISLIEE
jgi:ferredoxin